MSAITIQLARVTITHDMVMGNQRRLNHIANRVNLGRSLIPFHSLNDPTPRSSESLWLHAGDQEAWKIRIKATGVLLMNGIALAVEMVLIKIANIEWVQDDQFTFFWLNHFHLWSLLASNAILLVCSLTEVIRLIHSPPQ